MPTPKQSQQAVVCVWVRKIRSSEIKVALQQALLVVAV